MGVGGSRPPPVDQDPFAREFGVGKLSAFTLGFTDHAWSVSESAWKTPPLHRLVVYELMLHGQDNFQVTAGQERWLDVPGNYGRISTV